MLCEQCTLCELCTLLLHWEEGIGVCRLSCAACAAVSKTTT